MRKVKIEVSIPKGILLQAGEFAKTLGMTRNQLISTAITEFPARHPGRIYYKGVK